MNKKNHHQDSGPKRGVSDSSTPRRVLRMPKTVRVNLNKTLPPTTPLAPKKSSTATFESKPILASDNKIHLSEEVSGFWLGPMPIGDFLKAFVPLRQEKPREGNPFADILGPLQVDGDYPLESDIYTPFILSRSFHFGIDVDKVIAAKELVTSFVGHVDPSRGDKKHGSICPDVCFYESTYTGGPGTNFAAIDLVVEMKRSTSSDPFNDANTVEHPGQLASYMGAVNNGQLRLSGFLVFIAGTVCRLLRWDAAGVVVSEAFNYIEDDYLAEFFYRYDKLTAIERGQDTSITRIPDEDVFTFAPKSILDQLKAQNTSTSTSKAGLGKRLHEYFCCMKVPEWEKGSSDAARDVVISFPPNPLPRSVLGRATRPMYGYDTKAGKLVFLKQYWRACTRGTKKEGDIYHILKSKGVRNLATFGTGNDIKGSKTKTQEHRKKKFVCDSATQPMVPFILYRMILETIGEPLVYATSVVQALKALADAAQCHDDACVEAGILHRDVSPANIVISEDGTGYLIDWDTSIGVEQAQKGRLARRPERTATWQFLSAALLKNLSARHTLLDDRESFFWALIWFLQRRVPFVDKGQEASCQWQNCFVGRSVAPSVVASSKLTLLWNHKFHHDVDFPGRPRLNKIVNFLIRAFSWRYRKSDESSDDEGDGAPCEWRTAAAPSTFQGASAADCETGKATLESKDATVSWFQDALKNATQQQWDEASSPLLPVAVHVPQPPSGTKRKSDALDEPVEMQSHSPIRKTSRRKNLPAVSSHSSTKKAASNVPKKKKMKTMDD